MQLIAIILLIVSAVLTIDAAIFYGTPFWWSLAVGISMFLGPVLILYKYRQGAYISFFISFYIALAAQSKLDGSSLMETEAITKIPSPTNFSIYLAVFLTLLYILMSGLAILKIMQKNSDNEK